MLLLLCILYITLFSDVSQVKASTENFTNDSNFDRPIKIYDNFISNEDCDQLLKIAQGRFIDSTVYVSNQGEVDKSARSSSNVYFSRAENDIISKIENKVSNMLNIKLDQIEPLQIVKYEKGQQYKYHYDFFDDQTDQKNNQRTHTYLVYLNDLNEQDGGSTHFPYYKCKFYPYKTRAIHWENSYPDGSVNKLSLHAGEPILSDTTKYVLTIWTRASSY
jgi:prolyl 4-hydroxylase